MYPYEYTLTPKYLYRGYIGDYVSLYYRRTWTLREAATLNPKRLKSFRLRNQNICGLRDWGNRATPG